MKKAFNQHNKLVDIIESTKNDTYTCPVCKEILTRNFGVSRQFFSHPNEKGNDCELKLGIMMKSGNGSFDDSEIDILRREYYEKTFDDVNIELSDYMSEEGYYLTQEQKDIIFAEEDRIKIAALSGSAKTSTLYYYSKERPFKRILYLVYNKSMKEECDRIFSKLRNTEIRTIHSLAYNYVGKFYKNKLTFNYGIVDIIKDLNLNWNKDMELATKIDKMMKEYMLSDALEFNDINLFKDEHGRTTEERDLIILNCIKLWDLKNIYNNNIKITHDHYLKLFHLAKKPMSNKYDIILLDENQDSSTLVLDILKSSDVSNIVMVGDQYQQLYSWRNATNIMPLFEGKEYKLTTSFRVSQNIANIANIIIKDICKIDINMKGFNTKQTIVSNIDKNKPYVCLCRTNAYIFAEVFETIKYNEKAKLYFEGGFSSYAFNNILDGFYFSKKHKVKNPLFNKFEDYGKLIDYAKKTTDLELLAINRMIDKYGSLIPEIIKSIKNNTITKKSKADVLFSTVHRSKGMTHSLPVYISDDHFPIGEIFRKEYMDGDKKDFDINDYYEEMCILYVSITRCAGQIELSDKLKEYLIMRYNFYRN